MIERNDPDEAAELVLEGETVVYGLVKVENHSVGGVTKIVLIDMDSGNSVERVTNAVSINGLANKIHIQNQKIHDEL